MDTPSLIGLLDLSDASLDAFFRYRPGADESIDGYIDWANLVMAAPASEAVQIVVRLCERAPDEPSIRWVAITAVDPLIVAHGPSVAHELKRTAERTPNLRRAMAATTVSPSWRAWRIRRLIAAARAWTN